MIKNRYIQTYEIKILLEKITKPSDIFMKEIILSIYNDGLKGKDAINKFYNDKNKTMESKMRLVQRRLEKYSNKKISLSDLRRSFVLSNPLLPKKSKFYEERKKMSLKLRWKVLSRDCFKCLCCGVTSKDKELHVDHIKPVSKGGKTELNNLQTLCRDCNLGKKGLEINIDYKLK